MNQAQAGRDSLVKAVSQAGQALKQPDKALGHRGRILPRMVGEGQQLLPGQLVFPHQVLGQVDAAPEAQVLPHVPQDVGDLHPDAQVLAGRHQIRPPG